MSKRTTRNSRSTTDDISNTTVAPPVAQPLLINLASIVPPPQPAQPIIVHPGSPVALSRPPQSVPVVRTELLNDIEENHGRRMFQNTVQMNRIRRRREQPCRQWERRGYCSFGAGCKYAHRMSSSSQDGNSEVKECARCDNAAMMKRNVDDALYQAQRNNENNEDRCNRLLLENSRLHSEIRAQQRQQTHQAQMTRCREMEVSTRESVERENHRQIVAENARAVNSTLRHREHRRSVTEASVNQQGRERYLTRRSVEGHSICHDETREMREVTTPPAAVRTTFQEDSVTLARETLALAKAQYIRVISGPSTIQEIHRKRKQQPSSSSAKMGSPSSSTSTIMQERPEPKQQAPAQQESKMKRTNGKEEVSDTDEYESKNDHASRQHTSTRRRILKYYGGMCQVLNHRQPLCDVCGTGRNGFCNYCYSYHISLMGQAPSHDYSVSEPDEDDKSDVDDKSSDHAKDPNYEHTEPDEGDKLSD